LTPNYTHDIVATRQVMGKGYNQLVTILYGIEVQINKMKQILEKGNIKETYNNIKPNLTNDLEVET
jgi:hypothetical protein